MKKIHYFPWIHSFGKKQNIWKLGKGFQAFTLVELIVVITILSILGTIGFMNMGSFQSNARDGTRVSDLTNLSQALDITYTKQWSYPTPDGTINIVYSGWVLWQQWTIWDTVMNILSSAGSKLSKKPTDPLTPTKEYTYSKTMYPKYAFQLKTDYEWDTISFHPVQQAYAASGNPTTTYLKGNYNWAIVRTTTGSTIYIVTSPSLITSQTGTTGSNYEITTQLPNKLLTHGWTNSGGIIYTPKNIYSGSTLPSTSWEQLTLATSLATAYSGSTLASQAQITPYITSQISNDTTKLTTLGWYAIVYWLWGTLSTTGWWGWGWWCAVTYSSATTYTAGQCFNYTLPSGSTVTVSVTGPGYGTVTGTKALHTPACDTDDIAIWQNGTNNVQVWAACNVGASIAVPYASSATVVVGNITPDATEKTRIGNLYQWGNNGDITSSPNTLNTTSRITNCTSFNDSTYSNATNFILSDFTAPIYDWCTVSNDNLWGNTTNTSLARKGPCPTGYHVPTGWTATISTEWWKAYTVVNALATIGSCNQVNIYDRIRCALLIPLSGTRPYDGSWAQQWTYTYFWSSSPDAAPNILSTSFGVSAGNITISSSRAVGFSVRCLKN